MRSSKKTRILGKKNKFKGRVGRVSRNNKPVIPKEHLDYMKFNQAVDEVSRIVKTIPENITTLKEKKDILRILKTLNSVYPILTDEVKRSRKREARMMKRLLSQIKKENINIRPSVGQPLQTVPWISGRKRKPIILSQMKKKKHRK